MEALFTLLRTYVKEKTKDKSFPLSFVRTHQVLNSTIASNLADDTLGRLFVVFAHPDELNSFELDLSAAKTEFVSLPSNGRAIGDEPKLNKDALSSFNTMLSKKHGIVLLTLWTLSSLFPKVDILNKKEVNICLGATPNIDELFKSLVDGGYYRVNKVTAEGEFALRGEIIELFLIGQKNPIRITLDFDEVVKIESYDVFTNEHISSLKNIEVNAFFNIETAEERKEFCFLTEYFNENDKFLFVGKEKLDESYKYILNAAKDTYKRNYQNGDTRSFSALLPHLDEYFEGVDKNRIALIKDIVKKDDKESINLLSDGPRSYFGAFNLFREDLNALLKDGWKVYISANGILQKGRLENMLDEENTKYSDSLRITDIVISEGFAVSDLKVVVFSDEEIFKRKVMKRTSLSKIQSEPLSSFVSLKEGDLVVHLNYGIARFIKLDRIEMKGIIRDYVKLEFKNQEYYYVPIEMANLIERYIGKQSAELSSLSSKSWSQKKEKARLSAEKLARELIDLYAERKNSTGFSHSKDTEWQYIFEAGFCKSETPDQLTAISEIKSDMESPIVMDRLLCGDVGFGKTEVAFRAAFKAIMSGKQVAFLSPTTVLTHQHFENFNERIESFPIKTVEVSRIVEKTKIRKSLALLENGEADIAFGTHRLLQKDVKFKNLGLLIIDEEQRFGVKDKERIKALKTNVDTLALSATPIPRTLYMSLLKIRDISLLKTAPQNRKSIITHIGEFDKELVRTAIERELLRGGQVFYLHNRVEDIQEVTAFIKNLIPGSIVEFAHGSMSGEELEDIMGAFRDGGIQILISTTIIENGIDIPKANTIIVDNATIYGASQLYQLRGRVGRSDTQAYAYLFYKNEKSVTEDAIERLRLISESVELGSGFNVALRDMEMRGAGNLLGKEQSGFVSDVGLDLYIRLLDESVKKLEGREETIKSDVYVDIKTESYISDDYIKNTEEKFEVYKKIASCRSEEEYSEIQNMLLSRYGEIPLEAESLLYIAKLKITAIALNIDSIVEKNDSVKVHFAKVSSININRFLSLVATTGKRVALNSKDPSSILIKTDGVDAKYKARFIEEKLSLLL